MDTWNHGPVEDYRELNRASWDERAPAHAASPDYSVDRFASDPAFLSDVVRFDLPLLGDISGLRGVHLQCHIGTDTISLARLGADMTGLDFSPASLAQARRIAGLAGADVRFVEAEVYDAASAVAGLLRPGGRLFIREGHPMLWALQDSRDDNLLVVEYPYFERAEPLVFDDGGTYVETDAVFTHNRTHEWNHGLGEIITALMDAGMDLTGFTEHDSVPWEALPGQMERIEGDEWRLADRPWRLPHTYTLQAVRRR